MAPTPQTLITTTLALMLMAGTSPRRSEAAEPTGGAPGQGSHRVSTTLPSTSLDLHEAEFGRTVGEPIDRGFVFYDGQYLDAPYVVKRIGLAIFINDTMIEPPARWPYPQPDPDLGQLNPELPPSITKATSKYDTVLVNYLRYKIAYLRRHIPDEQLAAKLVDAYESLPNVDRAAIETSEYSSRMPHAVNIRWFDGSSDSELITPPCESRALRTKEELLASYEYGRKQYESLLREGGVYLLSNDGVRITMGAARVLDTLPRLLEILRSSKTEQEKFAVLQEAGYVTT